MRGLGPGQNCFSHRVQGPQRDGSSATGNPLPWKKSFRAVLSCAVQTCATLEAELEFPDPSTPHVDFLSQEGFRRKINTTAFGASLLHIPFTQTLKLPAVNITLIDLSTLPSYLAPTDNGYYAVQTLHTASRANNTSISSFPASFEMVSQCSKSRTIGVNGWHGCTSHMISQINDIINRPTHETRQP